MPSHGLATLLLQRKGKGGENVMGMSADNVA